MSESERRLGVEIWIGGGMPLRKELRKEESIEVAASAWGMGKMKPVIGRVTFVEVTKGETDPRAIGSGGKVDAGSRRDT